MGLTYYHGIVQLQTPSASLPPTSPSPAPPPFGDDSGGSGGGSGGGSDGGSYDVVGVQWSTLPLFCGTAMYSLEGILMSLPTAASMRKGWLVCVGAKTHAHTR
jgi:hypothetical protein